MNHLSLIFKFGQKIKSWGQMVFLQLPVCGGWVTERTLVNLMEGKSKWPSVYTTGSSAESQKGYFQYLTLIQGIFKAAGEYEFYSFEQSCQISVDQCGSARPKTAADSGPVADMLISTEGKGICRKEEGGKKRMFYTHVVFITSCMTREDDFEKALLSPPLFPPSF